MRSARPPALATWLLEHFRSGSENDYIAGDLMEAYERGRSRTWYWKEVLAAVVIGVYEAVVAHPVLALRAISVGWASWLLFYYGIGPRILEPLVRRFFSPSGMPFAPSMLMFSIASLVLPCSKWVDRGPASSFASGCNGTAIRCVLYYL